MTKRWDVTRAVRASSLPPPSRLIMHTLADIADVGTCEIPERFTPSLNELAKETGHDRSTVKRHLNALEEAGWVVRMRPTTAAAMGEYERTRYRLTIPAGFEMPASRSTLGAQDAHLGAEDTHPGRTEHPPPGAEDTPLGAEDATESDHFSDQEPDQTHSSSEMALRPDVEKVCAHLVDRIVSNGNRRPTITKKWRDEARLLIDKDGCTVTQILTAIDWCQDDPFWRGNILSMPKLRAKYDQLRQAARRTSARASPNRAGTSADIDWDAAMARAEAREAQA